jgi:hypothetical protein
VNGTEFRLSAWIKSGQKGKFMSLSIQPPRERQESRKQDAPPEPPPFDDDIPF